MDEVTLEKITFAVQACISPKLAQDFAIMPEARAFMDSWLDSIIVQVRQGILSQKLDEITVCYPADWWQAVKERFAPKWFLCRWPVEYNKTVIDVRAVYPKMAIPNETHFPLVRITSDGGATIDGWATCLT